MHVEQPANDGHSDASTHEEVDQKIAVSVLTPCLNEARTVAGCVERALAGLSSGGYVGEVIVADNGSEDDSRQIAESAGARVIGVAERGYGAALLGGIAAARGRYVVMADADGSYDFAEIPRFVTKLEEGYDLVVGNRFAGEIRPGAMLWHHRYVGNPFLSWLGVVLFDAGCRDFHCGLRAFHRVAINRLRLESPGMEFSSEMIVRAARAKLTIAELPITLHPDKRDRCPHLRSFRDGFRHLALLLSVRTSRRSC